MTQLSRCRTNEKQYEVVQHSILHTFDHRFMSVRLASELWRCHRTKLLPCRLVQSPHIRRLRTVPSLPFAVPPQSLSCFFDLFRSTRLSLPTSISPEDNSEIEQSWYIVLPPPSIPAKHSPLIMRSAMTTSPMAATC